MLAQPGLFTYLSRDIVAPFCRATCDLAINVGSLSAVFRMRLVLLLLFMMAEVFLIFLVDTVVHLLTEAAATAEQTPLTLLTISAKPSRTLLSLIKLALLRVLVDAALLSTAGGVG